MVHLHTFFSSSKYPMVLKYTYNKHTIKIARFPFIRVTNHLVLCWTKITPTVISGYQACTAGLLEGVYIAAGFHEVPGSTASAAP